MKWASNLYRKLSTEMPKSYVIDNGDVLENPEHATWRKNFSSLRSNLESRIEKDKSLHFLTDRHLFGREGMHDLYEKVLHLEQKAKR